MSSRLPNKRKNEYVSASAAGAVRRCPTLFCYNERKVQTERSIYSTKRGNDMHKKLANEANERNVNWFIRLLRWLFKWT